jgi:hypothetical protein
MDGRQEQTVTHQGGHAVRRIVGIQVHHSVNLDDASRFGVNMLTALQAAHTKSGSAETARLLEVLGPMVREVGVARTAAGLRLQMHQRDPDFKRYVEGDLPWPDETEEGFVPRCRCHDRCLFHDHGQGSLDDCNCDLVCAEHGDDAQAEAA